MGHPVQSQSISTCPLSPLLSASLGAAHPHRPAEGGNVNDARALLPHLEQRGARGVSTIFTSDESWFNHDTSHTAMWCETPGDVETRARPIINDKTLISVFWNFVGFNHIIDITPDQTYTSEFCTSKIIQSLDAALRSSRPQLWLAGTCLHWDNARPHVASNTREDLISRRVHILPHPPYSPDLSPSDFFLFGYLKYPIQGKKFPTSPELVTNLEQIMSDIWRDMLQKVYSEWIDRLEWVSTHNGEYYLP